jgi:uncharacterized protein (TIGR02588 family)
MLLEAIPVWTPGFLETVVIGVACSLVATLTWFFLNLAVRPRIKISPLISKLPRDGDHVGQYSYRFKIVNRSHRDMVDVQVRALLDKSRKVPGSAQPIHTLCEVPLLFHQPVIPGKRWLPDSDARFARRVRVVGDLMQLWPDDQVHTLRLRVTARDVFSGTFRQTEQVFAMHDVIRDGSFGFGKDLDVRPVGVTRLPPAPAAPVSPTVPEQQVVAPTAEPPPGEH